MLQPLTHTHTPHPATVHISAVVAAIASVPCLAAWALRHTLPLPANLVLWHIGTTGLLVAAAATETLAGHTTGLMGKVSSSARGGRQSTFTRQQV